VAGQPVSNLPNRGQYSDLELFSSNFTACEAKPESSSPNVRRSLLVF
jgi:hypothetical protein